MTYRLPRWLKWLVGMLVLVVLALRVFLTPERVAHMLVDPGA